MKKTICAIIAVKNEEKNIARCLNSLSNIVDHILVVDSTSQDATVEIAQSYGAEVIQFKKDCSYPKKRQFALNSICNTFDYAMLIDADEVISDYLANEIREILTGKSDASVYFARKSFHFLGKRLKYGGFDFYAACVVKPSIARFEDLGEIVCNELDMEVHERILFEGKSVKLRGHIVHEDFNGLSRYWTKHLRYAEWEAQIRDLQFSKSSPNVIHPSILGNVQQRRRYLKYLIANRSFEPFIWFSYHYLWRLGFLEGYRGYLASMIRASYILMIHSLRYEQRLKVNDK
jgi:glycosyltransferase involved in cell wall biosynthesis